MRILLDTNVLVGLAKSGLPEQLIAARAIETLQNSDHELCVVPQVLYEYWAVCTRPIANNGLGLSCRQAAEELGRIKTVFTLLRDERAILANGRGSSQSMK